MEQQSPYDVPQSAYHLAARGAAATAVGTTDTAVVLWPSVTDSSGIFEQASAAATGSIFTVVRPGIYRIDFYAALATAEDLNIGLSLNASASNALTGSPVDFAAADAGLQSEGIIAVGGMVAAAAADLPLCHCGRTVRLMQGDTLRFMATAEVTLDADNSRFFVDMVNY